jgi:hypothetical protein
MTLRVIGGFCAFWAPLAVLLVIWRGSRSGR